MNQIKLCFTGNAEYSDSIDLSKGTIQIRF